MKKKLYSSLLAISMVFNTAPSMSSITEVFADSTVEPAINLNDNVDVVSEIYNSFAQTFGANVISEASLADIIDNEYVTSLTISYTGDFAGTVGITYGTTYANGAKLVELLDSEFKWQSNDDSSSAGTITNASDWFFIDDTSNSTAFAGVLNAGRSYTFELQLSESASSGGYWDEEQAYSDVTFIVTQKPLTNITASNPSISAESLAAFLDGVTGEDDFDDYVDGLFENDWVDADDGAFTWSIAEGTTAGNSSFEVELDAGSVSDNYNFTWLTGGNFTMTVTGTAPEDEDEELQAGYTVAVFDTEITSTIDLSTGNTTAVTVALGEKIWDETESVSVAVAWVANGTAFDGTSVGVFYYDGTYGANTVGSEIGGTTYTWSTTEVAGKITVVDSGDKKGTFDTLFGADSDTDIDDLIVGLTLSIDDSGEIELATTGAVIAFDTDFTDDTTLDFLYAVQDGSVTITAVDTFDAVTTPGTAVGLEGMATSIDVTTVEVLSDAIKFEITDSTLTIPEMKFTFSINEYDANNKYAIGLFVDNVLTKAAPANVSGNGEVAPVASINADALLIDESGTTPTDIAGELTPANGKIALIAYDEDSIADDGDTAATVDSVEVAVGKIEGMTVAYLISESGVYLRADITDGKATFGGTFQNGGVYTVAVATDAESYMKYEIGSVTFAITDVEGTVTVTQTYTNTNNVAAGLDATVSLENVVGGTTITPETATIGVSTVERPTDSTSTEYSAYTELYAFNVTGLDGSVEITFGNAISGDIVIFEKTTANGTWSEINYSSVTTTATAAAMASRANDGTIAMAHTPSPSPFTKLSFDVEANKSYSIGLPTPVAPSVYVPSNTTTGSSSSSSSSSYTSYSAYTTSALRVNGTVISELQNISVGEMINLDKITTINGRDILGWYTDSALTKEITNTSTFVVTSDVLANGLFVKLSGGVSETLPDGSYNAGAGTDTSGTYTPSTVPSTLAKLLGKLF